MTIVTGNSCKLCRVIEDRGLESREDRLVREWKGTEGARKGYRTLARELNVGLLRREMDRAGVTTLADEAESRYDRLTGDDETTARETRELLRREGVPVDELESAFVSYGTVRTHLTECLGEEYDPPESSGRWAGESVRIATETARERAEEAVESLVGRDELAVGGDPVVEATVTITCSACQSRVDAERAIRRGHVCTCEGGDGDDAAEGTRPTEGVSE